MLDLKLLPGSSAAESPHAFDDATRHVIFCKILLYLACVGGAQRNNEG